MKRGDVVLITASEDFVGGSRPALVVQSDLFEGIQSVTFLPFTGDKRPDAELLRIEIEPTKRNGLDKVCFLMVDKITTVRASRVKSVLGRLTHAQMDEVGDALKMWLDLA